MSTVRIVDSTEALLVELGDGLAALPLLLAYGNTALSLAKRLIQAQKEGDTLRVALDENGHAVGLAWFLPRGAFATAGYLRLLAVVAQAQSKGAGRALLADFEKQCQRPKGGYFAWVNAQNQAAQAFYRRHGYEPIGPLTGFVRANETELLFHRASLQLTAPEAL